MNGLCHSGLVRCVIAVCWVWNGSEGGEGYHCDSSISHLLVNSFCGEER